MAALITPSPSSQSLEVAGGMRQDSERTQALARTRSSFPGFDRAYAACSTAHTAPQRSWSRRRCSVKDIVSFMCWR